MHFASRDDHESMGIRGMQKFKRNVLQRFRYLNTSQLPVGGTVWGGYETFKICSLAEESTSSPVVEIDTLTLILFPSPPSLLCLKMLYLSFLFQVLWPCIPYHNGLCHSELYSQINAFFYNLLVVRCFNHSNEK